MYQQIGGVNKGSGYPVLELVTPLEHIQAHCLQEPLVLPEILRENTDPFVAGVVRKYGLSGEEGERQAALLLEKLDALWRPNLHWIIAVNPRKGRDDETVRCFQSALSQMDQERREYMEESLSTVHITQPEGAANSWTAGLAGPAALLLKLTPMKRRHLHWIWNVSAETDISDPDLDCARRLMSMWVTPLTRRETPPWIHPAIASQREKGISDLEVIKAFRSLIAEATDQTDWDDPKIRLILARMTDKWRHTCSFTRAVDIERVGLPDVRCNALGGQEDLDWRLHYLQTADDESLFMSALEDEIVCYRDTRLPIEADAAIQAVQCKKFETELSALAAHCQRFVAEGRPTFVDHQHAEFKYVG